MKHKRRWGPPGWPWELELLALVFVIAAIAVPYYLQYGQPTETTERSLLAEAQTIRQQSASTWEDVEGFVWALVIVGLYLAHLAMGGASIDFMSTPFTHLFAPLIFSLITYYRLLNVSAAGLADASVVGGTPYEILLWVAGVLIITYLVARIRMARLMLAFRDVEWGVSTPTLFDKTYGEMIVQIRPLIYTPRLLRACEDGILVEGWFYAMPIPFDTLTAIDTVQGAGFASQGYCLATSSRSLVRIQTAERAEPILVSPRDRNTFVRYCQQQLAARAAPVSLRSGETSRGTRAGATKGGTKGGSSTATRPGVLRSSTHTSHGTTHSKPTAAPQKINPTDAGMPPAT